MKQQYQQHKYSIAWFKIADFISRGEKERALGVYRLLSHSIDDTALNLQLEGDILLACHDERAIAKYEQAALCYEQQGRVQQAIGIYEHLLLLSPNAHTIRMRLIYVYTVLNAHQQAQEHASRLISLLFSLNNLPLLLPLLEQIQKEADIQSLGVLIISIMQAALQHPLGLEHHRIVMRSVLDVAAHKQQNRDALLSWLEENDTDNYIYASEYAHK